MCKLLFFADLSTDWLNGVLTPLSTVYQSYRQLTLFMSFLGLISTRLRQWSFLPEDTPTKNLEGPVRLEPRTLELRLSTLPLSHVGPPYFRKNSCHVILCHWFVEITVWIVDDIQIYFRLVKCRLMSSRWQKLSLEHRRVQSKIRLHVCAGWSCSTLSAK